MIKLRLTGTETELEIVSRKITKHFTIVSQTKSNKNRESKFSRKYMEIENDMIKTTSERNKNNE